MISFFRLVFHDEIWSLKDSLKLVYYFNVFGLFTTFKTTFTKIFGFGQIKTSKITSLNSWIEKPPRHRHVASRIIIKAENFIMIVYQTGITFFAYLKIRAKSSLFDQVTFCLFPLFTVWGRFGPCVINVVCYVVLGPKSSAKCERGYILLKWSRRKLVVQSF